jgi:hypothetical protein
MKKIIFILIALTSLCLIKPAETSAQTAFSYGVSTPAGAILNTSADTLTYSLAKSYRTVSVQPVVTKATGTMAGTSVLYSSVNGTNYVSTGDTLTCTNVTTNTTVWNKTSAARFWRLIRNGATTVTGTSAAKISVSQ